MGDKKKFAEFAGAVGEGDLEAAEEKCVAENGGEGLFFDEKLNAAKVRARAASKERGWTLRNLRKAGLSGVVIIRDYKKIGALIGSGDYVALESRDGDFLMGAMMKNQIKES
ncbi:MAG: hypothetical protein ACPG32_04480 [Akkermansiaceae bacterium]